MPEHKPLRPYEHFNVVQDRNLKFYNTLVLSYGHKNIKLRVR